MIPPPPDWDSHKQVTGYWFLDFADDWTPPANLVDFLQAGSPPIFIGFGSMSTRNPEAFTRTLVQAVTHTGQRAFVWGAGAAWARSICRNYFQIRCCALYVAVSAHGGSGPSWRRGDDLHGLAGGRAVDHRALLFQINLSGDDVWPIWA